MSRVRANKITNKDASGAPSFTHGAVVTGIVTATSFTGNVTGDVTGNVSGSAGSATGNAATSTALQNARTIGGVSFDGTANINLPGVNAAGNQNTTGTSAGLTGTPNLNVGIVTTTRVKLNGSTETNIQTQAATAGGTTTLNMDTADNWIITMGGNTTMGDPTNEKLGQTGSLWMVQDGTGSRTAAWHSAFKWAGGTAPTLSTAANSIDRIDYIVKAAGEINAVASLDVK